MKYWILPILLLALLTIGIMSQNSHADNTSLIYYKMSGLDKKDEHVVADIVATDQGRLSGILFQGFIVHDVTGEWSGPGQAIVRSENMPWEIFTLSVIELGVD